MQYKFAFLASGCSSVANHGRGPGGWGGWAAPGADWVETVGWGATARLGDGGDMEGGQQWGCLQPLRTALHTVSVSLPKQFELKQSSQAVRALNARWALPVYPVFEDEKSKASDEKLVKRKIALKRPTGLI